MVDNLGKYPTHMGVPMTNDEDRSKPGPAVFHGLNFMQRPENNKKEEKAD